MCFPNVVAIFECNKILACVVSPKMRKDEQQRERERERTSKGEEEKGNIGVELKNKKKMV